MGLPSPQHGGGTQITVFCARLSRESISGQVDHNGGYERALSHVGNHAM
jgi:hypothetical protein